jgi:hypothetical protein
MSHAISVYCPTCFAVPGELCRAKYVVHGHNEVTPVICPTHRPRLVDSQKASSDYLFARLLCAVALSTLEQHKR